MRRPLRHRSPLAAAPPSLVAGCGARPATAGGRPARLDVVAALLPAAVRRRAGRRRRRRGHQPGQARRRAARPRAQPAPGRPDQPTPTWSSTSRASSRPSTRRSTQEAADRAFDAAAVDRCRPRRTTTRAPARSERRRQGPARLARPDPARHHRRQARRAARRRPTRRTPPTTRARAAALRADLDSARRGVRRRPEDLPAPRDRHQPRRVRLPRRPVRPRPDRHHRPRPRRPSRPRSGWPRSPREAREHGATTIFFETLVSPKVAETIAREVGAKTAVLDPHRRAAEPAARTTTFRSCAPTSPRCGPRWAAHDEHVVDASAHGGGRATAAARCCATSR